MVERKGGFRVCKVKEISIQPKHKGTETHQVKKFGNGRNTSIGYEDEHGMYGGSMIGISPYDHKSIYNIYMHLKALLEE